ncbi:hypothetical protein C8A01DRAFT_15344 [Parachaetomium inaequale]|uniref:Extracellular membrane protein CFEM domain-containing protein n=1 Tax=Parachaetomium inaequale TaxID=2588326 RepID=A0AAN6PH70_9PEZI|nr:hypothetical protein C8A01DRAFT_15344 [Parachaetomium inaequale]
MQPTTSLAQTLLFLLPLATAAATTTTTPNDKVDVSPRGVTNAVKGFFGDPVAKVNELSACMTVCAFDPFFPDECAEDAEAIDCFCNQKHKDGSDAAAGEAWNNNTKVCFDDLATKERKWATRLGCKPDGFEDGKIVDICGAVAGADLQKKNETGMALGGNFAKVMGWDEEEGAEGKTTGNGTGKESGAAAAAGAGAVARITGAVLAAAVGYAVAML